jgi:chromosome segregation ATPase
MSQAAMPFQGFEAQLEGARIKVRSLRQQLAEEVAARTKTKQVKDELEQVQDVREGRNLASENSLQGDKMRLMEQVSTLEKESSAESGALERLEANQSVMITDHPALQAKQGAALLMAKKQVREVGKTCDALKSRCDNIGADRDVVRDEVDELAVEIEDLKHDLAKALAKSLRSLGDRTVKPFKWLKGKIGSRLRLPKPPSQPL